MRADDSVVLKSGAATSTIGRAVEFWSPIGCTGSLAGLMRALHGLGWPAEHHFAVSEAEYRAAREPITRWRMRWHAYIRFHSLLRARLETKRSPTAIIVCGNTFYAAAATLKMSIRVQPRVPIVHWVYNILPDVLVLTGEIEEGGRMARRLESKMRYAFTHAAANVFIGDQARQCAIRRYGEIPRTAVIPTGTDGRGFRDSPPQMSSGSELQILCGGYVGGIHDTETITALRALGLPAGAKLIDYGRRPSSARVHRHPAGRGSDAGHVSFEPILSERGWRKTLRTADIALVTLRRNVDCLGVPNRAFRAMAAGLPILAVCSRSSDLAAMVLGHDVGWVVEPGDVAALFHTIDHLAAHADEVMTKRTRAFNVAHTCYDQAAIARAWHELLPGVLADFAGAGTSAR